MPSFVNYCHLLHDGNFAIHHVDVYVPPPEEYVYKWGVNLTERRYVEQGGEIEILEDGDIAVLPSVYPNDGTP